MVRMDISMVWNILINFMGVFIKLKSNSYKDKNI